MDEGSVHALQRSSVRDTRGIRSRRPRPDVKSERWDTRKRGVEPQANAKG